MKKILKTLGICSLISLGVLFLYIKIVDKHSDLDDFDDYDDTLDDLEDDLDDFDDVPEEKSEE